MPKCRPQLVSNTKHFHGSISSVNIPDQKSPVLPGFFIYKDK